MSVSIKPGARALTVTPREANSLATALVKPSRRRLAGRIIALPGVADQANDRGNIDDPPRPLLEKGPAEGLGKEKRSFEIGVQHRVPIRLAHAHDQAVPRHARVVDQNVHLPRLGQDFFRRRRHRGRVRHVHRVRPGPAAQGADFCRHFLRVFGRARNADDVRPGGGKCQARWPAQSPGPRR